MPYTKALNAFLDWTLSRIEGPVKRLLKETGTLRPGPPRGLCWLAIVVLGGAALATLPGCGGCSWDPVRRKELEEERKRREELARKEEPKPPFEPVETTVWPATRDNTSEPRVFVKPGHWMHVVQRTRANKDNFSGELLTRCVDRQGQLIELPRSPYQIYSSRPAALPKGSTRELGTTAFFPVIYDRQFKQLSIQMRLTARGSGREVLRPPNQPTESLKPHQFYMVVLARSPERYGFLDKLPAVRPPTDDWESTGLRVDYVVSTPKIDQRIPLPSHPLAWTSVAHIVWDDVEPDKLPLSQQEALIDWLHWGGQLVIVGPRSLPLLRGSFLDPYLPADDADILRLEGESLEEINRYWSVPPVLAGLDPGDFVLQPPADRPIQVTRLTLRNDARFVPTSGDLVAERRVGRGRVTVTAVALDDFHFRNWSGYDGFVNGVLLNRPSRKFVAGKDSFPRVEWAEGTRYNAHDARINTGLRYFTRDARGVSGIVATTPRDEGRENFETSAHPPVTEWQLDTPPDRYAAFRADNHSGVAGWNDFSEVPNEARNALQRAAGISVPNGRFVATVLGVYLLCLVPLNWLFFRIIGRVEWAWFAAPAIAVFGAIGVIRTASLDIGFVRSRTEIAVVEMQPDYARAHVSRFTGLYTSLSTQYTVQFDDRDALAMPFSTAPPADRLRQQPRREVNYRLDDNSSLRGFSVLSNSTGMMRSESLRTLDGTCRLQGRDPANMLLSNGTQLPLQQAVVVLRHEGRLLMALVGTLDGNAQVTLEFFDPVEEPRLEEFLEQTRVTAMDTPKTEVSLRGLYHMALHAAAIQDGDARLVAWSDKGIPGMGISPQPNQESFRTLLVAHLRYGHFGIPEPDRNVLADVQPRK